MASSSSSASAATAATAATAAADESSSITNLPQSKQTKRVLLKSIFHRDDAGLGLIGTRLVIGGWVKSCSHHHKKEVDHHQQQPAKDHNLTSTSERATATATTTTTSITTSTNTSSVKVDCVQILQTRVPLFRKVLTACSSRKSRSSGRVHHHDHQEKLEPSTMAAPLSNSLPPSKHYLQLNDGSCASNLQLVLDPSIAPISQFSSVGTSILVEGVLKKPSESEKKHSIELEVEKILHVGFVQHNYPLSKRKMPFDELRTFSHIRPRTTMVASITRIRSSLIRASHEFFQNHDFLQVHMPVIAGVDANGFSEKFLVTTLEKKEEREKNEQAISMDVTEGFNLQNIQAAIKEKSSRIEELKRSDSDKEALALALQDLNKINMLASQLEAKEKSLSEMAKEAGKTDLKDFFSQQMYLTPSSQLHLESYACALSNVYTFGPTFHSEKSEPSKNLAESWMVEMEMAFTGLEDVMTHAEDYIKFLCKWALENCSDDIKFLSKRIDKTVLEFLESVASCSFEKLTYTEAVELLEKVTDKSFEGKIQWGVKLSTEHESYLVDEVYKRPVIIYNHPKEVKPFSARVNDDEKTVATIDVIAPKVGTLLRGSQKEERLDKLSKRIDELGLPREQYEWYLDLRRHGTVKHSGFSLEFDRVVLLATGLSDIRDVIAFPRSCDISSY